MLQQIMEHDGFRVVDIQELIDAKGMILYHIRCAADWLVANGPAPKMLNECWMRQDVTDRYVFLLIYYQCAFFSHESLSPFQIDFLGEH